MRKFLSPLCLFLTLATIAPSAGANTCAVAIQRLQNFISQVNMTANAEYNQGIPFRCGPNPMCAQSLLQQLNYWYAQQSQLANGWYAQIANQCYESRADDTLSGAGVDDPMDEGDVEEVEVDRRDKTVKIKIPSNPSGFNPR